ncbi:hypothetical protein TNCT_276481 [Trichonephila clavata]|uniref:Uncharacterized protein n=1 Tax=Trichonephila clavata TaxID=2740835 RepID=A0A8X6LSD8_TRICU|nr:hypothetical protein TNCT_276481 [Trichonephila clavata]
MAPVSTEHRVQAMKSKAVMGDGWRSRAVSNECRDLHLAASLLLWQPEGCGVPGREVVSEQSRVIYPYHFQESRVVQDSFPFRSPGSDPSSIPQSKVRKIRLGKV